MTPWFPAGGHRDRLPALSQHEQTTGCATGACGAGDMEEKPTQWHVTGWVSLPAQRGVCEMPHEQPGPGLFTHESQTCRGQLSVSVNPVAGLRGLACEDREGSRGPGSRLLIL